MKTSDITDLQVCLALLASLEARITALEIADPEPCGRCALIDAVHDSYPREEFTTRTLRTQEEVNAFILENPEHIRLRVGDTILERKPFKFKPRP